MFVDEPNDACLIGKLDKSGKLVFKWNTIDPGLNSTDICLVGYIDEDGTVRLKWYKEEK